MPKVKKILDVIKDKGGIITDHGSQIFSHGKEIFDKGKDLVESKEGKAVINGELKITDAFELAGKVKDIYDNNITQIASSVGSIKNSLSENPSEDVDQVNVDVVETDTITENEDTFFEDSLNALFDANANALRNLDNPEAVLKAFSTLRIVANETIKYAEEQETKRVEINAQKEVAIEKIKAISDAIKTYIEKTFDERSAIFAKQFEVVDAALKNNNMEMLTMSLNSINSLAVQSPFKALSDVASVQKKLLDNNTEWDI